MALIKCIHILIHNLVKSALMAHLGSNGFEHKIQESLTRRKFNINDTDLGSLKLNVTWQKSKIKEH
jgi:hypothetical protein